MAQNADPNVRAALAARADLSPELLYFLAEDNAPEVRRAIAENHATPELAQVILAKDADEEVRTNLAERVALVAPGLTADEKDRVRKASYETLEILARDQMTRVREILSETLKDVADAPPEVIRTLAFDEELVVAGPVLEFSPVLTDEDLLEIIASGPMQGGVGAIARRDSVSEVVSDAVAETDDIEAIADLLSNDSAQIREETLDNLIDRAPEHDLWHAPLAKRPKISAGAASRMAQFMADNLLEVLSERQDLDAETLEAVKSVVHSRIDGETEGQDKGPLVFEDADYAQASMDYLKQDPPIAVTQRLLQAGKLDFNVITKALQASDYAFVLAAIVVLSDQSVPVVKRMLSSLEAKGVAALCWKSGFSANLSVQIQQRMARIPPTEVLGPKEANRYPLTDDEMTWQLEYYNKLVGRT
ncbi:MAG: DUF2336 domain-containing protein [Rhodospirillales bacterium]|nr:DUF2336 domain-containing protein [Rhodospirillales bacterium]